jgi:uncharacterized protein (TIGR03084 family)
VPVDLQALADDLALETASFAMIIDVLADADWSRPTPASGWSVADQVSHLAYFDEMAVLGALDRAEFERRRDAAPVVDANGDRISERVAMRYRGTPPAELRAWWHSARDELDRVYRSADPSLRVPWYGADMSVAAMLTARIMETWAHGHDVADALGGQWPVTAALRQVAHLAVRAIPNSFRARGRPVPDAPVRVELVAPDGAVWTWGPEDAVDRVRGPAVDLCLVATQRRHPDDTALVAVGPVATEWLTIAQAYAGPPGAGRPSRSVG